MRSVTYIVTSWMLLSSCVLAENRLASALMSESQTADAKMTYGRLKRLIRDRGYKTIEAVLDDRDLIAMRKRFVLIYKSASLHYADELYPRVLLFNSDASLVISFAGWPRAPGHGTDAQGLSTAGFVKSDRELEVVRFREDTAAFEFISIEFPTGGQQASSDVIFSDGVDRPLPRVCQGCHGHNHFGGPGATFVRDPRPNWNTEALWQGIYGSYFDLMREGSKEFEAFKRFLGNTAREGRYRYLIGLAKEDQTPIRIGDGDDYFVTSQNQKILRVPGEAGKIPGTNYATPNFRLSRELNRLNIKKVARAIAENPDFSRHAAFLLLPMLNDLDRKSGKRPRCADIESLVPQPLRSQFAFDLNESRAKVRLRTQMSQINRVAGPIQIDPQTLTVCRSAVSIGPYFFVPTDGAFDYAKEARRRQGTGLPLGWINNRNLANIETLAELVYAFQILRPGVAAGFWEKASISTCDSDIDFVSADGGLADILVEIIERYGDLAIGKATSGQTVRDLVGMQCDELAQLFRWEE